MPMSEFRQKKLLYVFNVFFDVNQSGTIDRKDFELAIEKICTLRGWSSSSPQYKRTFDAMIQIWDGLRKRADSNKDGQVSVDEWSSMWDEYARHPDNPLEWQTQYLRFMFDLEDASADGTIDTDEFVQVCSCYGLAQDECTEAFQRMGQNSKKKNRRNIRLKLVNYEENGNKKGANEVNFEQFQVLWKQFFMSEDPSEPGNFIFGKTKF